MDQTYLIGSIQCMKCKNTFTIKNPYFGKKPLCFECRNVTKITEIKKETTENKVIPSIKDNWVMKSNNVVVDEKQLIGYHGFKVIWKKFQYPFNSCGEYGNWSISSKGDIPILGIKYLLDSENLKKSTIYFHQYGQNDEKAWIFVAKFPIGAYVYFNAWCDYTGFDCRGGGSLRYANDWNTFWTECLDTSGRSYLEPKIKHIEKK